MNLAPGDHANVIMLLVPGATLSGRVFDMQGAVVTGASVVALGVGRAVPPEKHAVCPPQPCSCRIVD